MIDKKVTKTIPLTKGHYGGPADTVSGLASGTGLIYQSRIPLGFYWGEDICIDDTGAVRARPSYALVGTSYTTGTPAPISCFKLGGTYFTVLSNGTIQYDSSGWATIGGTSATGTSKIYVDYISAAGNTSANAIVSRGDTEAVGLAVNGTTGTPLTGNAKGLMAQDENRLFAASGGYLYFSLRGDYTSGYAANEGGQWFTLGPSCYPVIGIMQIAGTLYVIKQCSSSSTILIYKKVSVNSDSEELLDMTYFSSPLGVQDALVSNGMDGICSLGGNIFMWMRGQGLGVITENGADIIGDAIMAENSLNTDYDAILAPATNFRMILAKPVGTTTSFCYNIAKGLCNGKWNINVTGKGYGEPRGMFCVSGNKSPYVLSGYATTTDATIVSKLYTPSMNFELPQNEKFLTKVFIDGLGITSLKIYRRLTPNQNFTLEQTISNPTRINYLNGECRFGDLCLLLEGNQYFLLRNLGVEFDVGGLLVE